MHGTCVPGDCFELDFVAEEHLEVFVVRVKDNLNDSENC